MKKFLLLCTIASILTACSLPSRAPITPTSWVVMPERTEAPLKRRTDFWLKVGSVNVAPPFDTKSLVYRLGDARYEKDFYNVYTAIPSEMIGSAERQWFNKANIFAAAVGDNNTLFSYYTLQATVNEFYGDYRTKPEAVVSVEFILSVEYGGKKGNPLLGANRYTKRVALKDNTPEALILGQQEALAAIFKEYETQLYQYAGSLPKPLGQ